MTMAISMAVDEGAKAVVCASTGNTSASAAAYALAGRAWPAWCSSPTATSRWASWRRPSCTAPGCCRCGGTSTSCSTIVRDLPNHAPITVVNSVNPHRIEGQKTGAFEIVDVLGDAPDVHCIPVGNAGNISAYWRGYLQYKEAGRSTKLPAHARASRPPARRPSCSATRWRTPRRSPRPSASATRPAGTRPRPPRQRVRRIHHGGDRRRDPRGLHVPRPAGVRLLRGGLLGVGGRADQARACPTGSTVVCVLTGHGLKDPDLAIKADLGALGDRPRPRLGPGRDLALSAARPEPADTPA